MDNGEPRNARPEQLRDLRGFRRWRRTRPFWGGLFTALAGLQIFGTTQMSLAGLALRMGTTGFLSWLIPAILVTCGLLMWFKPPHRVLYAVVAAVTALFSLIGVNLGGFFVGLLLGLVGSALGFAWTPDTPPSAAPASEPAGAAGTRDEPADDASVPDEAAGDETARPGTPADGTGRDQPTAGSGADLSAPDAAPSTGSRPSSTN
ncbi:DUF6114 domain-containing protein [Micromonospora sp. U56]|uniref:DUF6114 domain-containing protein n=1 Tax=Micromonospora sp. U56 TaxID=2824900 RepID=UPI0027DBB25B|nr:DUF6114 domain-containing protein [Micromonospora sp. U56]